MTINNPAYKTWLGSVINPYETIAVLEKSEVSDVDLSDIADALDEYVRLFKAEIASPAEILTLSRAYPNEEKYSLAVIDKELDQEEPVVIGGPASVEVVDREGHLITLDAMRRAFERFMANFRTRNAMVLHSDVQVGWALPAYIAKSGKIYKSGVTGDHLFFITELRNDTKIAKKVLEQIDTGKMKSYSIAGSATSVEPMQKASGMVMQVNDMELAEVTICEQGVNQKAKFELMKSSTDRPTTSCVDGSCLIKAQTHIHSETELFVNEDGIIDTVGSLTNWVQKQEGLDMGTQFEQKAWNPLKRKPIDLSDPKLRESIKTEGAKIDAESQRQSEARRKFSNVLSGQTQSQRNEGVANAMAEIKAARKTGETPKMNMEKAFGLTQREKNMKALKNFRSSYQEGGQAHEVVGKLNEKLTGAGAKPVAHPSTVRRAATSIYNKERSEGSSPKEAVKIADHGLSRAVDSLAQDRIADHSKNLAQKAINDPEDRPRLASPAIPTHKKGEAARNRERVEATKGDRQVTPYNKYARYRERQAAQEAPKGKEILEMQKSHSHGCGCETCGSASSWADKHADDSSRDATDRQGRPTLGHMGRGNAVAIIISRMHRKAEEKAKQLRLYPQPSSKETGSPPLSRLQSTGGDDFVDPHTGEEFDINDLPKDHYEEAVWNAKPKQKDVQKAVYEYINKAYKVPSKEELKAGADKRKEKALADAKERYGESFTPADTSRRRKYTPKTAPAAADRRTAAQDAWRKANPGQPDPESFANMLKALNEYLEKGVLGSIGKVVGGAAKGAAKVGAKVAGAGVAAGEALLTPGESGKSIIGNVTRVGEGAAGESKSNTPRMPGMDMNMEKQKPEWTTPQTETPLHKFLDHTKERES